MCSVFIEKNTVSQMKKKVGWLSLDGEIITNFFSFLNFPKFLQ